MLEMMLNMLASLSLPDNHQIVIDYFLKDYNTPFWHWLWRGAAGLGFLISIAVYLYYSNGRHDDE